MRCKNCGWPNKPNETTCVKCGSPLETSSAMSDYNGDTGEYSNDSDGFKKTVMESEAFGSQLDKRPDGPIFVEPTPTVREITCPKCGYPIREDAAKCPNCNFQISDDNISPSNANTNGFPRRPTRMTEEADADSEPVPRVIPKAGKIRGTINPYMMEVPQDPTFVLKPLQRMNERKVAEPVEIELENGEVVLTRDNTEPDNLSITSKNQAVISHSEGRWYIENSSEQKTTFILASRKTEIHDGDIILLGNRMFEFKEQK